MTSPDERPDAPAEQVRTGHSEVDAALDALDRAGRLPPAEQITVFEAAHRTLQEALAAIDEGQS